MGHGATPQFYYYNGANNMLWSLDCFVIINLQLNL